MTQEQLRSLADRLRWIDQQHHAISLTLAMEVCRNLPDIVKGLDVALQRPADEWEEIARLKVELASRSLQITGLEAALAPFAKAADLYRDIPGIVKTNHNVELWQKPGAVEKSGLTVGDLRRAERLLDKPLPVGQLPEE